MKLKVKGDPSLVRDSSSKAIIANDKTAYSNYIQERNFRSQVQHVEADINNLKQELGDIKSMLQQLISNTASK